MPNNNRMAQLKKTLFSLMTAGKISSYMYNKMKGKSMVVLENYVKRAQATKGTKRKINKNANAVVQLKKKVSKISKLIEGATGTLIYKTDATGRLLASVNGVSYGDYVGSDVTTIENVIAQLRYYDPSAPSALVTADATTGSYQKEIQIVSQYGRLLVRNNYQIPCKVKLYVYVPKEDTSIAPSSAFSLGLADIGNPSGGSILLNMTDSEMLNDLYRIHKSSTRILAPGAEASISMGTKGFQYDPSFVDTHALSYQKRYNSFIFTVRVEGVLAHDSSADEQGIAAGGVDTILERKFVVKYNAGIDLKYMVLSENLDTFTNGALVSQYTADNQAYSVS